MSENANLKATVVFLTYRSVIEDIIQIQSGQPAGNIYAFAVSK